MPPRSLNKAAQLQRRRMTSDFLAGMSMLMHPFPPSSSKPAFANDRLATAFQVVGDMLSANAERALRDRR